MEHFEFAIATDYLPSVTMEDIEEHLKKDGKQEDKLYITKEMTAAFFDVDIRTISRNLEQNGQELMENGY